MNNVGLISVIVPMYNQELYIEKCIKSLQKQTYLDLEILIVDDGSIDNSADIVKRISDQDKRIKYFYKANGGLSSARNYGLERANGKYVCFIDSDDYVNAAYLEELLLCINDEVDIVIGRFSLEDEICNKAYIPNEAEHIEKMFMEEEKIKYIVLPLAGPQSTEMEKRYQLTFMPVWKNLYRRSFLNEFKLRFVSEREVMFEDYLFNIKSYYYANAIYVCDSSQYVHCLRQNSLSRRYRENYFSMIQNMYRYIDEWVNDIEAYSQEIKIHNIRMETKWILDVMYNMTYAGQGLYSRINEIVESDFVKHILAEVDSFHLEAYYKVIYILLKKKQTRLLTIILFLFRKMERLYRLYRKRRG